MVLAACARPDARRVADFGSGAGAVGLAVASRLPAARATLVERDPEALDDARGTLAHVRNAALADRVVLLAADLLQRGAEREASGLRAALFDHVLANPPYNDARHRVSPDTRRAAAHMSDPATFDAWTRTAAATLVPGGRLTMIVRPANLASLLAAWDGRFSGPALLPLHTRPGAATRVLVHGRRGGRNALAILPSLRLHDANGPTHACEALTSGDAWLDLEGEGAVLKS